MAHKFDPKHAHKLDAESFRKEIDPSAVLKNLGLTPKDIFIDIGCGTGYYLKAAASKIARPDALYGLDTSGKMLRFLKKHTDAEILARVKLLKSREYSFPLPDALGSFVLLSTVLHEVDDKVLLLAEVRRVLKPGGRIGVIEFEKKETPHGPPLHHRISAEETAEWLSAAGFSRISLTSVTGELYACTALSEE